MNQQKIIGAIVGDVIGSVYEHNNVNNYDFLLFSENSRITDDSILTVATMEALLNNNNFVDSYQKYGRLYPNRDYGANFSTWIYKENPLPYNSYGNGSAMRVSPIGWFFDNLSIVLDIAYKSAIVSHDHPEGIKGAQAIASCVFLARNKTPKPAIKTFVETKFGYNLNKTVSSIKENYSFDVSCQGSVPESIVCFIESTDFESAIRNAIYIGGDSDTIASITASISEAFYGFIPKEIYDSTLDRIPEQLISVVNEFSNKI